MLRRGVLSCRFKTGVLPALAVAFVLFVLLLPVAAAGQTLPDVFCRALVLHTPEADAAYQPGIDVHGKSVAPADLEGAQALLPEELSFPLTVDWLAATGLDAAHFPFTSVKRNDLVVGILTLRDGRLYLDGKPLSDAQQDNLAVLCLEPDKKGTR